MKILTAVLAVPFLSTAAVVSTALLAGASGLAVMQFVENRYYPVLVDWKPQTVRVSDTEVVVSGTQRKVRDCRYIPPIRAETETGIHLQVMSRSPTTGQNWISTDLPRAFGPWVIPGGSGLRVHLYAEHQCHPLWPVFSPLGVLDTR